MEQVALNITDFRERFVAFTDETLYPDATIQTTFDTACLYRKNATTNCLTYDKLEQLLYLLTAHLLTIQTNIANGDVSGTVQSASIDKISVSYVAPTNKSELQYWLNQTPYGQQYLVLSKSCVAGGFTAGGRPVKSAYLKRGRFF